MNTSEISMALTSYIQYMFVILVMCPSSYAAS